MVWYGSRRLDTRCSFDQRVRSISVCLHLSAYERCPRVRRGKQTGSVFCPGYGYLLLIITTIIIVITIVVIIIITIVTTVTKYRRSFAPSRIITRIWYGWRDEHNITCAKKRMLRYAVITWIANNTSMLELWKSDTWLEQQVNRSLDNQHTYIHVFHS